MAKKNPDIVFGCNKCQHEVYCASDNTDDKIRKILKLDCPKCGEEAYENWTISRMGNYDKEYGEE